MTAKLGAFCWLGLLCGVVHCCLRPADLALACLCSNHVAGLCGQRDRLLNCFSSSLLRLPLRLSPLLLLLLHAKCLLLASSCAPSHCLYCAPLPCRR